MRHFIDSLTESVVAGKPVQESDARALANASGNDLFTLFAAASRIKSHFLGSAVHLCSIINAKSGRCPENCAFCAQSAHHATDTPVYPLVDEERIVANAREAEKNGSRCFGIITSGTGINKGEELDRICRAVRRIRQETKIAPACSLGIIDFPTAAALREAGVETYHHNLETARSFFPEICTTHNYEEDVETVRVARRAGLKVCCGGIFGLGESVDQRIEMALTLRELDVNSVPLNFLNPIEGTRLAGADNITPLECLRTIALYRFILPDRRIAVCGGRERNLRDLQSWIFLAGADGTMIGNYLTTTGRPPEQDWQMLKDLELAVEGCCE
ncbi:biotin synthase BioB [Geobacter sp.]|uniref:biotin synthase BioB n=1 Tax=Geobacter sp. TaxID=46610 RepID=UPI00261BD5E9|nr:biotin synthase BioB [Geobacter sp.]